MANYTSIAQTIAGQPGQEAGSPMVVIQLTPNDGYIFDDPHGLSIIDTENVFDQEDIVRNLDGTVTITVSLRDDIDFPSMDTNVPIRIQGDAVLDVNTVDVILTDGDGSPVDTDGDGVGDTDIHFEDEDGNGPLSDLDIDVDGMEGDEVDVGNAVLCPIAGRRYREDRFGRVILPRPPRDRRLGNGAILRYVNPRINDDGCVVYSLIVVIGSDDTDGTGDGSDFVDTNGDLDTDLGDNFSDPDGDGTDDGLDWDIIEYDGDLDDGDPVDADGDIIRGDDGNPIDTDGFGNPIDGDGDPVDGNGDKLRDEDGDVLEIDADGDLVDSDGNPVDEDDIFVLDDDDILIPVDFPIIIYSDDPEDENGDSITGGGEDIPDEDDADAEEVAIYSVDINSDNLDPIEGGFIIITATGTPGATGVVTLTPNVIGTGTLPDSVSQPIVVNLEIEANGIDVVTVRIPSVAGDENLNPLCTPDLPDNVDGIMWGVDADQDNPDDPDNPFDLDIDIDTIMQDNGGMVIFNIASSDTSTPIVEGSMIENDGWIHRTIIQDQRGRFYPDGVWELTIPPGTGAWNLIDDVDGIVYIDADDDITCDAGINPNFCDGTAQIVNGSLVIRQPYSGGIIPQDLRQCTLSLDNIATRNTEVRLNWNLPADANYTIAARSQSEFAYAGVPGSSIPTDGGTEPTEIVLVANDGYTWSRSMVQQAIMTGDFSVIADAMNDDATQHFTITSVTPGAVDAQDALLITELTITWSLTGNFRDVASIPPIADVFTIAPTFNTNQISEIDFNIGPDMRGQASFTNARFSPIASVRGIEGDSQTITYTVTADGGYVFKSPNEISGVIHPNTTASASITGETLANNSATITGTVTVTFGDEPTQTVFLDGPPVQGEDGYNPDLQPFRVVDVNFVQGTILGQTTLTDWVEMYDDVVEGDVITQSFTLTADGTNYFQTLPSFAPTSGTLGATSTMTIDSNGEDYTNVINGSVSYTITSDPTQTVTLGTTGGDIDYLDVILIRTVVESPANSSIATPAAMTHVIEDDETALAGTTVAIQFDVHTESGFAWPTGWTTADTGVFNIMVPAEVTMEDATLMGDTGTTFDNGDAFIRVTAVYTVPAGTAGGSSLSTTITIDAAAPTALATITATPDTLTFGPEDGRNESQSISVELFSPGAGTDTISFTRPADFDLIESADLTEGGDRLFTIYPEAENRSVNDSIVNTVTFGSTQIPTTTTTVNLIQTRADLFFDDVEDVVLGMAAGSTFRIITNTNGALEVDGTNLESGFDVHLTHDTGIIEVTAENANNTLNAISGGSFTITSSSTVQTDIVQTVNITQTGLTEVLSVNTNGITLPQSGGAMAVVAVSHNNGFTAEIDNPDGFRIPIPATVAVGTPGVIQNNSYNITRGPNNNVGTTAVDASVSATITLTSTGMTQTETITVNQLGLVRTLTINDSTANNVPISRGNGGGAALIEVRTNDQALAWTATVTTDDDSIITSLATGESSGSSVSATGDDDVAVGFESNGLAEPEKTATIIFTFTDSGGNAVGTRTVTATLLAGEARTLTINGNEGDFDLDVANTGGAQTLTVASNDENITWAARALNDDDSIISTLRTTGTEDNNITFSVAENGAGEPEKTADIVVTFGSGDERIRVQTITITLAAGAEAEYEVNPDMFDIFDGSGVSGIINVSVNSSIPGLTFVATREQIFGPAVQSRPQLGIYGAADSSEIANPDATASIPAGGIGDTGTTSPPPFPRTGSGGFSFRLLTNQAQPGVETGPVIFRFTITYSNGHVETFDVRQSSPAGTIIGSPTILLMSGETSGTGVSDSNVNITIPDMTDNGDFLLSLANDGETITATASGVNDGSTAVMDTFTISNGFDDSTAQGTVIHLPADISTGGDDWCQAGEIATGQASASVTAGGVPASRYDFRFTTTASGYRIVPDTASVAASGSSSLPVTLYIIADNAGTTLETIPLIVQGTATVGSSPVSFGPLIATNIMRDCIANGLTFTLNGEAATAANFPSNVDATSGAGTVPVAAGSVSGASNFTISKTANPTVNDFTTGNPDPAPWITFTPNPAGLEQGTRTTVGATLSFVLSANTTGSSRTATVYLTWDSGGGGINQANLNRVHQISFTITQAG